MVIQLLVNLEAPDISPGRNGDLNHDLKALAVDCLSHCLARNSAYPIKSEVIELPTGTALTAASELLVQVIKKQPLLTKSDLCQRLRVTPRTIERYVENGQLPRPMHVHGPRWRPEDIAVYESSQQNGHAHPYSRRD